MSLFKSEEMYFFTKPVDGVVFDLQSFTLLCKILIGGEIPKLDCFWVWYSGAQMKKGPHKYFKTMNYFVG